MTARVTHCERDLLARGAYSSVPMGVSCAEFDKLAAAVEGRLFFAGEATTLHGAYLSGLREARRMVELSEQGSRGFAGAAGEMRRRGSVTARRGRPRRTPGSTESGPSDRASSGSRVVADALRDRAPDHVSAPARRRDDVRRKR